MKLPDLVQYKSEYQKKGIILPLLPVVAPATGLLNELPSIMDKKGWPWQEQTCPDRYNFNLNWPKLSIIVPSFNQSDFLEQTIRSILLQNYPNLELIVIDGGSTDNSINILEKYTKWISFWHSEKDNGQGNAINKGFSLASGDYYAWINSDDYYLPDVFNLVITKFLSTKADFIYGYSYSYNVNTDSYILLKLLPYYDFFSIIPSIHQTSTFWKANIHQPIWEELYCSIDFELWMRMLKGKKKKMLKTPLSVANGHDQAKTFDPKIKAKWEEDEKKIWSDEGHGQVPHWNKVNFINQLRLKLYRVLKLI